MPLTEKAKQYPEKMFPNDKRFLIKVISQCLPFIGYPRSLNTLRCVNEAAAQNK